MKKRLQKVLDKMDDIKYGYVDKEKNIHSGSLKDWAKDFSKQYLLQSPEELITNKYGVCWDQVELERYYLEQENIKLDSYFIIAYDNKHEPTHTFIVVEANNKYYWLEHSWESYRGIYEYDTLIELFNDLKIKFKDDMVKEKITDLDIAIYKYKKPKYNISCIEFMDYCKNGEKINF